LLERLEEYRADENKAFLLIGLFGGACLGIFSNWATNENFTITRASLVLLGILAMLTVFCAFWAFQINKRAKSVRERMLDYTILRAGENIIEPLPTENQDENPINKPQNTDSDSV
jgi:hypothetical protein